MWLTLLDPAGLATDLSSGTPPAHVKMLRCHPVRLSSILAALPGGAWNISAARQRMRSSHPDTGALGRRDDRDSTGVRVGASLYLGGLAMWQPELPGLRVDVGDKQYLCGHGEPLAELRTDRFTLFRALSGRRSAEQIRALDWTGSPEPYLGMFAPYGPRPTALDE